MSEQSNTRRTWVLPGIALGTIGAAWIATGFAVAGMWIDSQSNATDRCFLDSRFPGMVISNDVYVDAAYATALPAGRYCLWRTYDGAPTVEQTGWITTWIALLFLVFAIIAFVALIRTIWWVPATLGMIIVIGGWITIADMSDVLLSPVFWPMLPPSQQP